MLKQLAAAVVVTLAGLTAAAAGPAEDAYRAYVRGDFAGALLLLRPLADQGDAWAQTSIALMYRDGEGVAKNLAEAAKYYRLAAEQGDVAGQFEIAIMYEIGEGVAQSYTEAAAWYKRAADRGHAEAQAAMAQLYRDGRGVAQNYVLAHMWFSLAIKQGKLWAGATTADRDAMASKMTAAQIAEAQRLAAQWKPTG
jgi:TPR repeat protein